MVISPRVRAAIEAHALAEWPAECCGVLVKGDFYPCQNIADEPLRAFQIKMSVLEFFGYVVDAVIHSHVADTATDFSEDDCIQQRAMNVPYGLLTVTPNGVTDLIFIGGDT